MFAALKPERKGAGTMPPRTGLEFLCLFAFYIDIAPTALAWAPCAPAEALAHILSCVLCISWLRCFGHETACGHQCRRSHRGAAGCAHPAPDGVSPARRAGPDRARLPRGHLHGAIQLSHRPNPGAARHCGQRLVPPRTPRSAVLETIQSPG